MIGERLGIRPGHRGRCTFCGHATMSVKRDDTLAKCFHPSCGRFVTAGGGDGKGPWLSDVLEEVYRDWRAALTPNTEAYRYLVEERRIKPEVVRDSMLGMVPPGYSAAEKLGAFAAAVQGDWAAGLADKFHRVVACNGGAIAFFYSDARHRITSIKLRRPGTKEFAYFKPMKRAGVFGHGLFAPTGTAVDEYLLVVEGEFNQLAVQSIVGEYVHCAAVGGAGGADFETIKAICRKPVVAYDNDEAGMGLVRAAQEHMTVEAFTTPHGKKDLDEWVRAGGTAEGLAKLVAGRTTFFRSFGSLQREIRDIRRNRKLQEFEIHDAVGQIVVADLADRGAFYRDTYLGYYFSAEDKLLTRILAGSEELALLLANYGLYGSERAFAYVFHKLVVEALARGRRVEVRKFAHYDVASNTSYVFNHRSQIHRVRPGVIDLVDNGTDGVLFAYNRGDEPFELVEIEPGRDYLHEFVVSRINFEDGALTVVEQRCLLVIWLLALFFPALMPTRPILALIGEKGSGKSMTARTIGRILTGPRFNVAPITQDHRDFDSMVVNNYLLAVDNVDSRVDWLNDRLATIATGQTLKLRPLYKDITEALEVPTSCFPIITSRTPHFRRDDVADRLLILRLSRFEAFEPESELLGHTLAHRNEVMSFLLHWLRDGVLAALARPRGGRPIRFRMADFADFARRIAGDRVEAIFAKMAEAQSAFTLEGEPLLDLLHLWVPKNAGRPVAGADLFRELGDVAEEQRLPMPYKSGRSMGQRLRNIKGDLARFFVVEERVGHGRTKLWVFWPKPDEQSSQSSATASGQSSQSPQSPAQSSGGPAMSGNELRGFGGLGELDSLPFARGQGDGNEPM